MPLRLRSAGGGSVQLNSPVALATDVSVEVPGYAGAKILTNKTPGCVLQVIQAIDATSTMISTSSSTPVSSGLSLVLTPNSASNKILLNFTSWGMWQASGQRLVGYLYRNGVNVSPNSRGLFEVESPSGSVCVPIASQMLDSPNTTSPVTYGLYFKSANGGAVYLVNNAPEYGNIQLTAMEIAA